MSVIRELHSQLTRKERTAVEITTAYLERIQSLEPKLHSYLAVTADHALAQAQAVDAKIAAGDPIGLLAGIPLGLKDNLCTQGIATTCASKILKDFVPPYESTATQKLIEADAICLGKTNLDEFAMGGSTENSAFGRTANPWDVERVPGGSSGGSAAAVAADECVVALGSDTGGSIRQPASLCGIVGMKPTYGLVSRYGLVAFASSLDQIGPLTRTVEDAAIVLQAIAGHDPKDSTSLNVEIPNYVKALRPSLERRNKRRIGVIKETFGSGLDAEVETAVKAAIEQLQGLGAEIQVISCPQFRYGVPTYYIIAPSEASSNLARFDGVRYGLRNPEGNLMDMYTQTRAAGFGPEVKRRIMIGTYALSAGYYDAYYLKAQKVRTLIKQDFENAFSQVDALVCPTSPTTTFKAGAKANDPLSMYLLDLMTIPVNLAGLPAISLPCGFDQQGLPIGMQLIGNVLKEGQLLEIAYAYEQSTPWHKQSPTL